MGLGLIGRFVVGVGERLLPWQPEGSLLIELPNGRCISFGRERPHQAVLKLKNYRVIRKSIRRGGIGFAEAYLDGDVECADLVGLFRFVLRNYFALRDSGRVLFRQSLFDRFGHMRRRNSRRGSRRNIVEHYDLGNAFFEAWLDDRMIYSSALYKDDTATLDEAQDAKLNAILEALRITPGMSVLEIGSGWGALAHRAARDLGASVTAITLSDEQLAHADARAKEAGLEAQLSFKLEDYRDTQGQYDRVVSIEMIEAVGEQHWPSYFKTLYDRLKPGGTAIVQAITIGEIHYPQYRRQPDFIQRYIFPGGMLPTKTIMEEQAKQAGLEYEPVLAFGSSYARTLRAWRERFEAAWPEIAPLGFDERFYRKWYYYLAYCEAGFLEDTIDVGLYRLMRPEENPPTA